MNDDLMNTILAQHADRLHQPNPGKMDLSAVSPDEREQTVALFGVAERTKHALRPVSLSPAFRARLKDGLMLAAHHQQTHQMLTDKPSESTWGWLIGAAAIGSAAGIIAFVLRLRSHSHRIVPSSELRTN